MRIRFWKASALAAGIVTGSVLGGPLFGQETKNTPVPPVPATGKATADEPAKATPKGRTIALKLVVSDVGSKGCEVEVKPANPSCVFKTQSFHLDPLTGLGESKKLVTLTDVDIRGADRNCAVAVTVRQDGLPPKTIYRGFRVAASPKPGAVESFETCMSCPTKASSIATTDKPGARR
ncbi:hypothetical protein [Paludisphaera rhizosphaerae]|uniref:hypothetical protein n=1 Tax=Paludisphaera rhizosphaerae TaxID=2711216 RepID=UPI0013EA7722|nr:hypothetical protein [Paludisphaera rhizosphaerae]